MPALTKTFVFRFLALLSSTVVLYSTLHSLHKLSKLSSTGYDTHGNDMSSTIFSTDTLPADERLMATIGNGFLATRIYSDSVFVSGVYNGRGREPSHRARIPSTVAIRIALQGNAVKTTSNKYSLDVQKGLFTHRIQGKSFDIEELIYAHRELKNLLVVELRVQNLQGEPLRINLTEAPGNKSEDIHFTEVPESELPPDSSDIEASYGFINTTEQEDSERVGVAVVSSKVPESVIIQAKANNTFYFVTAIVSTLNTVGFLESAYSFHKQAISRLVTDGLLASHSEAWAELWQQSGIEVEGNVKLAQVVYGYCESTSTSLSHSCSGLSCGEAADPKCPCKMKYLSIEDKRSVRLPSPRCEKQGPAEPSRYLAATFLAKNFVVVKQKFISKPLPRFSSIRSSWPFGLSPGSLSSNDYWGHSFWDTETWMYPTLLMLYPEMARSLLLYRFQRMKAARENARSHNVSGTMYPWESAFTGYPVCPEEVYSNYEIHVNGDIGYAVEQYWMVTGDRAWLTEVGIPLISGIAEFWASRVTYDDVANDYVINSVMCPDEYHSNVNNSAFTNAVAKRNLEFAGKVVPDAPKSWSDIAMRLRIPYDPTHRYHPEYDGYDLNVTVKQADVILLGYPLMFNMTEEIRKNDLVLYEPRTDPDGPAMTKAMFAVGWLELGSVRTASRSFRESYQNVREPFKVWTEYRSGDGAVNFITGMGGFLQAVVFGYGGLRLHPDELRLNTKLPENVTELRIRGLHYRGNVMDLTIGSSESTLCVRSARIEATSLIMYVVASCLRFDLEVGKPITFQNGDVYVREREQTLVVT